MATRKRPTAWSEGDYAQKGLMAFKVQVPIATLSELADLAVAEGTTRTEVLVRLVGEAHKKLKPKK